MSLDPVALLVYVMSNGDGPSVGSAVVVAVGGSGISVGDAVSGSRVNVGAGAKVIVGSGDGPSVGSAVVAAAGVPGIETTNVAGGELYVSWHARAVMLANGNSHHRRAVRE